MRVPVIPIKMTGSWGYWTGSLLFFVMTETQFSGSLLRARSAKLFGNLVFISNGGYLLYVYCSLFCLSFLDPAFNKDC